ncbi:MAG: UDP-N-acetylmuramoyl-L-alanine--D-glutamate ligase [Chlorobi bacterium]|nr:UDP-N-acetylmuramoyl-L-alanine--D-glutamate ligase [Chlorobiota bacterium]
MEIEKIKRQNKTKKVSRIVILGAGESGVGAAILAKKQGFDVFVSDFGAIRDNYKKSLLEYNILYEEGKHTIEKITNAELIIKSPGISDEVAVIKKLKKLKKLIISELEFAAKYTQAYKICVTGSNGKTTTCSMIYDILQKAGLNAGLAGNIGKSFALQVALNNYDYYVLEISSFQLDGMFEFKADIAVLMNITPDHLDRYHNNFRNYINSKFRIINNQQADDKFIYCTDDPVINKELENRKIKSEKLPFSLTKKQKQGAYVENNQMSIIYKNQIFNMNLFELALQGKHNAYNSMAAGIAAHVLSIRKEDIRESLSDFQGVEHRLEPVVRVHGIDFINDSKATNVNSTWYALESMSKKVVWIVGGIDKGNDYSMLTDLVKEKVKAIVCLGENNTKFFKYFGESVENIVETGSMIEAVKQSYKLANKGDIVLLSPACASFDLFDNYEDRGRQFKTAVRNL